MGFTRLALIAAMVRNMRSKALNRKMIGYTFERTYSPITMKDVEAYVEATRGNISKYGGKDNLAPPFIMSRVLYPMFRHIVTHPRLKMNLLRMVHGQQAVMWYRPFKIGEPLTMRMTVRDIEDTPAGEMINILCQGYVQGDLVCEAVTAFIVRGTGEGVTKRKKREKKEKEKRQEAFRLTIKTEEGQQYQYAEVSGDKNFIHTSNFLARLAGLPRTIMHGVCLLAMATNSLTDHVLKGDVNRLKGVSTRFAKPVFPGDTITLVAYKSPKRGEIHFDVFRESGKPVMKNGIFRYR